MIETYFKRNEMECPCCKELVEDKRFTEMMYSLRILLDIPLKINSWYRCEKHNKVVGSKSDNHPQGMAADILCCGGTTRLYLIEGILKVGFKRMGLHQNFVHVDNTNKKSSLWVYYDI